MPRRRWEPTPLHVPPPQPAPPPARDSADPPAPRPDGGHVIVIDLD
jgi:hypothetical protein